MLKSLKTLNPIETRNGTLSYNVYSVTPNQFIGIIDHNLHKHLTLSGKILTRKSKKYHTQGGATNWLGKERNIQINK